MGLIFTMILVPIALLLLIFVFAKIEAGFFYPEANKVYVILRGQTPVNYISGDPKYSVREDKGNWYVEEVTEDTKDKPDLGILYRPFGIICFGFPFIHHLGKVEINYPPQIRSVQEDVQRKAEWATGFDIVHTYKGVFPGTDFQGGVSFILEATIATLLRRPDIAWRLNGSFLNPLAYRTEGRIKGKATAINATEWVGMSHIDSERVSGKKSSGLSPEEHRREISDACMDLNININDGGKLPAIQIEEQSGYKLVSVSYKDSTPENDASRNRLKQLEDLAESLLDVEIAAQETSAKKKRAEGDAALTRETLLAEAAGAEALFASYGGDKTLMGQQIAANAHQGAVGAFRGQTLIVNGSGGNGSGGVQPVFTIGGATATPPAKPASK